MHYWYSIWLLFYLEVHHQKYVPNDCHIDCIWLMFLPFREYNLLSLQSLLLSFHHKMQAIHNHCCILFLMKREEYYKQYSDRFLFRNDYCIHLDYKFICYFCMVVKCHFIVWLCIAWETSVFWVLILRIFALCF